MGMSNRYYKIIKDGYFNGVGIGRKGGEEITKEEYDSIMNVILNCPKAEKGFCYILKADLTWELCELPPVDENRELSDSEALEIILGGNV